MKRRSAVLGLLLPVTGLLAWQGLSQLGILNPLLFPPPSRLFRTAVQLTAGGELPAQVRATLGRVLLGFLIGSAAGLIGGLAMGAYDSLRRCLEPMLSALYSTPKLTLLPLLMLLVGVGETARLILVATASLIIMAIHCVDAVRRLNRGYVELAVNYGAGPQAVFRRVYLPGCLPQIFTGLRLAFGRALVMTVSIEMVGSADGLGGMIWMAWQTFMPEKLYVAVFTTAALGFLSHFGLRSLETSLVPWERANERS